MTKQQWIDLAQSWLTINLDPGSAPGDSGLEAESLSLAFGTGITITANGETWRPSREHLYPGTANFKLAAEALKRGNVSFTGDLNALIALAKTDKAAHDACDLICRALAANDHGFPPALARWKMNATRPRKGAHKPKPRNRAIVQAVRALVAEGLNPLQNDSSLNDDSKCNCACYYVAKAANLSYDSVKKTWAKAALWEKLPPQQFP